LVAREKKTRGFSSVLIWTIRIEKRLFGWQDAAYEEGVGKQVIFAKGVGSNSFVIR